MISSNGNKFRVREVTPSTATRPNGLVARRSLLDCLQRQSSVVVDMTDVVLTPSFADEFLGVLLVEIGEERFRRDVKIVNVPETARPLLRQVLARRAAKPNVDVAAHNLRHSCSMVL
jgi:hypothetical protein